MIDVLIVHYNIQELTEAAIRSLWKHTPDARVTIFDNSDKLPLKGVRGVQYIDNTQGQIVDWDEWLAQFPDKYPCKENNYGSAKHCYSVEVCMDMFHDGFVLMDSDVLVKQDITPLCDSRYAWAGHANMGYRYRGFAVARIEPFICWINTPMLAQYGIRYFNPKKMWKLSRQGPDAFYDTGAWLLEDCNCHGLVGNNIEWDEYVLHFGNGSWKNTNSSQWLGQNKELWQ